jgi:hypothetical protein
METTLAAVTLVSLALASFMGMLTWRVVALDRRREAARVAALAALAAEDDLPLVDPDLGAFGGRHQASGNRQPDDQAQARLLPDAWCPPIERLDPAAEPSPATEPSLFSHAERESPAGRRLVAVVGVAALMAVAIGTLLFTRGSANLDGAAGLQTGARVSGAGPSRAPLELVSLRHERIGDRLTITGLVRNPRDGARVERANAVAFVFDPGGTFVASGRALVDFVTLDPGDESPFVVTVTAAGPIGRYRVGFRRQDGAVVGHVDRRATI